MFKPHITPIRLIFATMLIDMIGLGIMIPILPDLIRRFSTDHVFVTTYYGYFIAAYALMQFLASPVLGALSDKFGRRPILLGSLLGAGIDYLIMAFAPNLWILFIGRIVSGITGASFTVANSYVADISDDTNRAANFGMIGAAFGLGFIVGPLLGGALGHVDPRLPFIGAAIFNLLNVAVAYYLLPESLPMSMRRNVELKKLNPFTSVIRVLKPSPVLILIIIFALMHLAGDVHPSNWTLYTQYKFGWTAFEVGVSLATVGVAFALSQVYLTRVIIPKIGEYKSIVMGLIVYVIGFAAFAYATEGWMMYAILVFLALSGIAMPATQSLITATAPPNQQGELQGSLVSIMSLMAFAAPLGYTFLFAHYTSPESSVQFSGICYLAASIICVIALALFLVFGRKPREVLLATNK